MKDLSDRFERLVGDWPNENVTDQAERAIHVATFRTLAGAALFALPLLPLMLWPTFPLAVALPAAVGVSSTLLMIAGLLAATGSLRACGVAALLASMMGAMVLVSSGGTSSSLYLLGAAAIPVAVVLLGRTRDWLLAGLAAGCAVPVAAYLFGGDANASALSAQVAGIAVPAIAVFGFVGRTTPEPVDTTASDAKTGRKASNADESAIRRAFDLLPGLVTMHDASGRVTGIFGNEADGIVASVGDLSGSGFLRRVHVADRIEFLRALDRLRVAGGSASVEIRMERVPARPDGDQFLHLAMDIATLDGTDNRGAGFMAQSRIVEQRVDNRAAEIAKAGAEVTKTRILASVSHELRTPLNAIIGFTDVLAQEFFGELSTDRQREYVELIRQSGAHLLSVVNTMLDMSKIEAGRYDLMIEQFSVAEAVSVCEAMFALQAREKGVSLIGRVAPECGEIHADRRALNQILINLVGNAIKFTDAGGVVTIDAVLTGDTVAISVNDTGIGIENYHLPLLGQPFVQVNGDLSRRYEGTGLGLSLVKGLVALHGGVFKIESEPGAGTAVTVELAVDGSRAQMAEADAASVEIVTGGEEPEANANSKLVSAVLETDHGAKTGTG